MGKVSRRNAQLVILCEDQQQESFILRFLKKAGWSTRRIRIEKGQGGSAEQFVRERFPIELDAYRKKRNQVGQAVIVMMDGDNRGVSVRLTELDVECQTQKTETRRAGDRVAIFIPTWNIETWLFYLAGGVVDESKGNYPRLDRQRNCRQHVNALLGMCESGRLRFPAPPSLESGCDEYAERLGGGAS